MKSFYRFLKVCISLTMGMKSCFMPNTPVRLLESDIYSITPLERDSPSYFVALKVFYTIDLSKGKYLKT